eukprot:7640122-Heterocapsa_arctica.AAC.1
MRRRRQWSNLRHSTGTNTYNNDENKKKERGGEGIITRIHNNNEERDQKHYKEHEKRENKEKQKQNESSRRRYSIEGCRACGRSTETPASLLGLRSASLNVRVLD